MMTTLEKNLIYVVVALISCGAFAGWWALHNRHEQSLGAVACLQATTIPKAEAIAGKAATAIGICLR